MLQSLMNIQLLPDEKVVIETPANHFKNIESVGGRLYITNQRVFFKSHPVNIQNHELSIPFSNIRSYGKRNTLGIFPNGIYIEKNDLAVEKFVVWKRDQLLSVLNESVG